MVPVEIDTQEKKVGKINRCYIAGADDKDWKTVQVLIVSDEKPSVDDRIVVTATNSEKLHIGRILRVDEIRDNKLVCGMFVMETKEVVKVIANAPENIIDDLIAGRKNEGDEVKVKMKWDYVSANAEGMHSDFQNEDYNRPSHNPDGTVICK